MISFGLGHSIDNNYGRTGNCSDRFLLYLNKKITTTFVEVIAYYFFVASKAGLPPCDTTSILQVLSESTVTSPPKWSNRVIFTPEGLFVTRRTCKSSIPSSRTTSSLSLFTIRLGIYTSKAHNYIFTKIVNALKLTKLDVVLGGRVKYDEPYWK